MRISSSRSGLSRLMELVDIGEANMDEELASKIFVWAAGPRSRTKPAKRADKRYDERRADLLQDFVTFGEFDIDEFAQFLLGERYLRVMRQRAKNHCGNNSEAQMAYEKQDIPTPSELHEAITTIRGLDFGAMVAPSMAAGALPVPEPVATPSMATGALPVPVPMATPSMAAGALPVPVPVATRSMAAGALPVPEPVATRSMAAGALPVPVPMATRSMAARPMPVPEPVATRSMAAGALPVPVPMATRSMVARPIPVPEPVATRSMAAGVLPVPVPVANPQWMPMLSPSPPTSPPPPLLIEIGIEASRPCHQGEYLTESLRVDENQGHGELDEESLAADDDMALFPQLISTTPKRRRELAATEDYQPRQRRKLNANGGEADTSS
ncbi:uncharacterized protein AMSG_01110 [Thecamonas trahens ATCC 50062]|uniref:Uncharacterized protein n=1 Tax=Thecamonas trahens ATCC 50062 TaxID=461836 RepID=A0A0L0DLK5_THETB|nr:hypothetical protein AMSG_01110 [Thecamonas trahens ATCC 50062]KNC52283.1 hypothetical protein AMSG_01110 [Thecamonas trahens ATCC 50062]|eukprot:XP_013762282.1 hypothetical protein AMSG_01110 [Thecamonas trahens ATCC 50062]